MNAVGRSVSIMLSPCLELYVPVTVFQAYNLTTLQEYVTQVVK